MQIPTPGAQGSREATGDSWGPQGADPKSWAERNPGSRSQPWGQMGGHPRDTNRDSGGSPAEVPPGNRRKPQAPTDARDQGADPSPQDDGVTYEPTSHPGLLPAGDLGAAQGSTGTPQVTPPAGMRGPWGPDPIPWGSWGWDPDLRDDGEKGHPRGPQPRDAGRHGHPRDPDPQNMGNQGPPGDPSPRIRGPRPPRFPMVTVGPHRHTAPTPVVPSRW